MSENSSSKFHNLCEASLSQLSSQVEQQDQKFALDVEYADGILKIVVSSTNQTYVINRNSGNQKIWYSSPITGADYFSFDEEKQIWVDKNGEELSQKLFFELKKFL